MKGFVILFHTQLNKIEQFGTKLTSLELDWACDMTHSVYIANYFFITNVKYNIPII